MFGVNLYSEDGQILTYLTQWDINQRVYVQISDNTDVTDPEVHFYNKKGKTDYLVENEIIDNRLYMEVPNVLLQEDLPIYMFIFMSSQQNPQSAKTVWSTVIPVKKRLKPPTYIYDDNTLYLDLYNYMKDIDQKVTELTKANISIDEYEIISVNGVSIDRAMIGQTATSLGFRWAFNKTPVKIQFDGNEIDSLVGTTVNNLSLTYDNNKSWELYATDENGRTVYTSLTLPFLNMIFYGADIITLALFSDLQSELTDKKEFVFNADAGSEEEEKYIWFCIPHRFGTPIFNIGGFDGGFELAFQAQYTNESGYTETYDCWRSEEVGLGECEVSVKWEE